MKKRQALKILKNWPRFCYTYDQLYRAFHTVCHMKNQHGIRPRKLTTEPIFRNMVRGFTKEGQESLRRTNERIQFYHGQSNMELAS